MVQASEIAKHMEVLGSDGQHVGIVDHVEGDTIKLARRDSPDRQHHYVPVSLVARLDGKVHLSTTAAEALTGAAAVSGSAATNATTSEHGPLPPVRNRAVDNSRPRGNFYLPWIVALVGAILILLLLLRGCSQHGEVGTTTPANSSTAPATAPLPVQAVLLPDGKSVTLVPNTLNYDLQRYLASKEATPKTFQFDKLNFDTASAKIRSEDQANVDALGQILAAYPNTHVKIVGYTDARGTAPGNAHLGQQRADAVTAALVAKGIDKSRIESVSGGESNPTDTNATAQGQFENRRTELVVTAK